MSIKTTVHGNLGAVEIQYPCYQIAANGDIVLFTAERTGTIIHSNVTSSVGTYSESWFSGRFTPFYGTITIEVTP